MAVTAQAIVAGNGVAHNLNAPVHERAFAEPLCGAHVHTHPDGRDEDPHKTGAENRAVARRPARGGCAQPSPREGGQGSCDHRPKAHNEQKGPGGGKGEAQHCALASDEAHEGDERHGNVRSDRPLDDPGPRHRCHP